MSREGERSRRERPGTRPVEPILRLRGVVKRFGPSTVLDGLSLDVAPGERVALIGPSGSGKSTLLRVVMTLEKIDGGEVEIAGTPVWYVEKNGTRVPAGDKHLRQMRSRVGMVFQHFHLFPHKTVLGNLTEAPIHVLGKSREAARALAMELLDRVGLGDRAEAWPAQLSGGQKQRVAIARALAMEPEIMLFDEVTSALDPELVGEVLNVLRGLARETRMTMLIVTHQMHFARDIADRVVLLDGGRIVEEGPPARLFTRPIHERTRIFLERVLEAT